MEWTRISTVDPAATRKALLEELVRVVHESGDSSDDTRDAAAAYVYALICDKVARSLRDDMGVLVRVNDVLVNSLRYWAKHSRPERLIEENAER